MDRYTITPHDTLALIQRLAKDKIPVRALYVSASNAQFVISGLVQSLDEKTGIVISMQQPPSRLSGYLSVPFVHPDCCCSCGVAEDELREKDSETSQESSTLTIHFPKSREFLLLLFTPTCALASLFPIYFAKRTGQTDVSLGAQLRYRARGYEP
jgi:hypothetical protein